MQILLVELLCFFTALTFENAPLVVQGLLNQSVRLSYPKLNAPLNAVYWSFTHINGTVWDRIADIRDQQLTVHSKQFANRTETNEIELQIRKLRMEDAGTFKAILIPEGSEQLKDQTYDLTVYEPVPVPNIEVLETHSDDLCNFTLECSVPTNTKALFFSWKTRHRDLAFQPYINGSTIWASLRPESWGNEYLCIVQNPVDQKNVSVTAQDICLKDRQTFYFRSYFLLLPLSLILLLLIAGLVILLRRKNNKEPAPTGENLYSETLYIEVERNQQNEIEQEKEVIYSQPKKRNLPSKSRTNTIYTVIQHNT
ncbi:SLAM family member 5 isoform X2 [Xenopus laevis]|uniref:SLAM family member 5 isoform X2 n=1 Tax=Xenopus laevis TaxID=8355 RepID=A0A8J1LK49_XENLA|nr:SLAM family member 5 isoform X2 [Xenopus laevis]